MALVEVNQSIQDVEERVPGKQGLKPLELSVFEYPDGVEERVPGKQGLKRFYGGYAYVKADGRRASSRKTRIETRNYGI